MGRVYTTMVQNVQNRDLIEGMLLLENFFVKILFNTGATHSFIAKGLARQLRMKVYYAPFRLKLVSLMGIYEIVVKYVMADALFIKGYCYPAQLILLELVEFDLILGMD